jgi:hypothetical protein
MVLQRVGGSHKPLSSSSQPPSPTEEDLSKPSAWEEQATSTLVPSRWKGKGKQEVDEEDDDDDDDTDTIDGDSVPGRGVSYPPVAEEDLESRKVQEVWSDLANVILPYM